MNKPKPMLSTFGRHLLLPVIAGLALANSSMAQPIFSFPFNEGPPSFTFTDTAQNLSGFFGTIAVDTNIDIAGLTNDSPSGLAGDGAMFNSGKGFLVADDSASKVLNITNGPITMESWIKINGSATPGNAEGIVSYGGSYKMGFKTGVLVFTLLGKVDITNSFLGGLGVDQWIHVATAWSPGVGVTYYIGTNSYFVANTNTTARVLQNPYLSLGNEGFANSLVGSFDRIRIHNAILTADQIDNDPLNPKPTLPSTIVSYNFNESALPATNSLSPSLPASSGAPLIPVINGPTWTNGVNGSGDFALYFDGTKRAVVPDPNHLITLGPDVTGTNGDYTLETWVKLPLGFEPAARMIMFQYQGSPGLSFSINTGRTLHTTTFGLNDINSAAVVPNDNQWHHVAAVHQNGSRVLFYIDGVLRSGVPYVRGPGVLTTFQITIGGAAAANPFTGTLDRIRLTKGALTPAQFDIPSVPPPDTTPGNIIGGLVLHLKLDETNGLTAFDNSGNNRNGTLVNFSGDNSYWIPGRIGGGLFFNTNALNATGFLGNTNRIIVDDGAEGLNFATNSTRTSSVFTVSAWIRGKTNQIVGSGIITKGFGGGGEQYNLDVLANGAIRFFVRNSTNGATSLISTLANGNTLQNGDWVHAVGVCDGSNPTNGLKLYINGLPTLTLNAPAAVTNNTTHEVSVGARKGSSTSGYTLPFSGLIDDVRIYGRALTPRDVAVLFADAEAAHLSIRANGSSGVLSWLATSTNFIPQRASSLVNSNTVWTDLPGTPTTEGYNKTLPISLTSSNEFYRLRSAP